MPARRTGAQAVSALAAGALVAGGIALSAPAGAADRDIQPRSTGYQYGNWSQPGSGFITGSDDTMSQVYQLTWRGAFPDLAGAPGPVYAAGTFITSGSTAINRVGQWNGTSWVPLTGDVNGIDPGASRSVTAGATVPGVYGMALGGDDSLYIGGQFTGSDDTLNNVGRWNGTDWVAMGLGLRLGTVGNVVQDTVVGNDFIGGDDTNYADDTVYALGGFVGTCATLACTSTGRSAVGVAQYSQTDDTWYPLGTGTMSASTQAYAGAYIDDTLYVGGDFTQLNGAAYSRVAQWSDAVGSWRPLGAGLNSSVFAMAVHPTTKDLYVGGTFSQEVGGAANSLVGVAKWDYTDDTWYAVGTGLTGPNTDDISFSADGKTMWIGSWANAPTVSGTTANGVAKLTSDAFTDSAATAISGSWQYLKSAGVVGVSGPSNGTINQTSTRAVLAQPSDTVLAAGNFHTAGPIAAGRVALFTPGAEPSPFDPVFPAAAPTDVVATPGWNKVTVDWKAPTYTGSYPITNYLVQAAPGGRVCITSLRDANLNQCTYTNLTPGTNYTFTVQALNGAGWGDRSAASNVASPYNLRITSSKRTKRSFFVGGGSTVEVSGVAPGYANGTRITPWLMWNNSGTWEEQTKTSLSASNGRFAWKRNFSRNQNSRTLSVKFSIAPNESNSVSMGPVR
jgi:hypothetical protein